MGLSDWMLISSKRDYSIHFHNCGAKYGWFPVELGFQGLKDTKIRLIRAVKGVEVILGSLKASRAVVCHRVGCYLYLHLMSVFLVISEGWDRDDLHVQVHSVGLVVSRSDLDALS